MHIGVDSNVSHRSSAYQSATKDCRSRCACVTLNSVRDPQVVEEELVEISNLGDDTIKFERLIAWSAAHPDEVTFALRFLSGRSKGLAEWARKHLTPGDRG